MSNRLRTYRNDLARRNNDLAFLFTALGVRVQNCRPFLFSCEVRALSPVSPFISPEMLSQNLDNGCVYNKWFSRIVDKTTIFGAQSGVESPSLSNKARPDPEKK